MMHNIYQWAIHWNIPPAAIMDLKTRMGLDEPDLINIKEGESEAAIQTKIRLEASQAGCRLYRNNVGVATDNNGNVIRYGLCNESKRMNDHMKSSDLIGIRPVIITPQMVGCTFGQFMAREVKPAGWVFTGTDRETAQLKFISLINFMGGDAAFANKVGTIGC